MDFEFYKKFERKFSKDGEIEFYAKIENMKKGLDNMNDWEKSKMKKSISEMICAYENMKKYYRECVDLDKKIQEERKLENKLRNEFESKKDKYIEDVRKVIRNSDGEIGFSNN